MKGPVLNRGKTQYMALVFIVLLVLGMTPLYTNGAGSPANGYIITDVMRSQSLEYTLFFYKTRIHIVQPVKSAGLSIYINSGNESVNVEIFGGVNACLSCGTSGKEYLVKTLIKTINYGLASKIVIEGYNPSKTSGHYKPMIGYAEILINNTGAGNCRTRVFLHVVLSNKYFLRIIENILNVFILPVYKQKVVIRHSDYPDNYWSHLLDSQYNATVSLEGIIDWFFNNSTEELSRVYYDITYGYSYNQPHNILAADILAPVYPFIMNATGEYYDYVHEIIIDLCRLCRSPDTFYDLRISDENNGLTMYYSLAVVSNSTAEEGQVLAPIIYTILISEGYSYQGVEKLVSNLTSIEKLLERGDTSEAESMIEAVLGAMKAPRTIITNTLSGFSININMLESLRIISEQNGSLYFLPDKRRLEIKSNELDIKPYPSPLDAVILYMIMNHKTVLPRIAIKPSEKPAIQFNKSNNSSVCRGETRGENRVPEIHGVGFSPSVRLPPIESLKGILPIVLGIAVAVASVVIIDKRRGKKK